MDLDAGVKAILESTYSASAYQSSLANDKSILFDLAEARLRLKELKDAPSLESNQQQVEYAPELGVATENMLLDNDIDLWFMTMIYDYDLWLAKMEGQRLVGREGGTCKHQLTFLLDSNLDSWLSH